MQSPIRSNSAGATGGRGIAGAGPGRDLLYVFRYWCPCLAAWPPSLWFIGLLWRRAPLCCVVWWCAVVWCCAVVLWCLFAVLCVVVSPLAFGGVAVLPCCVAWCVVVSCCAAVFCVVVLPSGAVLLCPAVCSPFLWVFLFPFKTIFRFLKIKIKLYSTQRTQAGRQQDHFGLTVLLATPRPRRWSSLMASSLSSLVFFLFLT